jgi:ankyrin repeat protein
VVNTSGQAPLIQSIEDGGGAITRLLLEANADPNFTTKDGLTPLHVAVQRNMREVCELLLHKGADPAIGDRKYGRTPLHLAVEQGLNGLATMLIANGASPLA